MITDASGSLIGRRPTIRDRSVLVYKLFVSFPACTAWPYFGGSLALHLTCSKRGSVGVRDRSLCRHRPLALLEVTPNPLGFPHGDDDLVRLALEKRVTQHQIREDSVVFITVAHHRSARSGSSLAARLI
jgi:hypothetical protein